MLDAKTTEKLEKMLLDYKDNIEKIYPLITSLLESAFTYGYQEGYDDGYFAGSTQADEWE